MKPIKLFYQARCPFCKRAFNYIDELKKRPEYKDIVIETIEETEHPDIADQYDYYYVPTFYIADERCTRAVSIPTKSKLFSKRLWYKSNEKFLHSFPRGLALLSCAVFRYRGELSGTGVSSGWWR